MTDEELKRLTVRLAGDCVRREYCTYELRTRLERRDLSPEQIAQVMEELTRRRFVDDTRYAHAFVRTKLRAGWGVRKISYALRAKQIPAETISTAITGNTDSDTYLATALKAARLKARRLDLTSQTDRAKLYRFLASRGYESPVITRAIAALRTTPDHSINETAT